MENIASSFDTVVAPPEQAIQNKSTDTTNQAGQDDLLKALTNSLAASRQVGEEESGGAGKRAEGGVDYTGLFSNKQQERGNDKTQNTAAGSSDDTAKAGQSPEEEKKKQAVHTNSNATNQAGSEASNAFLANINDDKLVDSLVSSVSAPTGFVLSDEILAAFDSETGEVTLTPELLAQTIGQASQLAQQNALRQTIGLIRELVPAVTASAQNASLASLNQAKQLDKVMTSLDGNEALQQLAQQLAQGRDISDGDEFTNQINSLLHAINEKQLKKTAPKVEGGLSNFLANS